MTVESASDAPRTVWAVSSGSHSDYRVLALFEREEDANAAVAANIGGRYDEPFVEEFPLFAPGMLPRKVAYWRAYAAVNEDGTSREVSAGETLSVWRDEGWTGIDWEIPGRRPTVTVHEIRWNHASPVMYRDVRVVALTERAAIKACSDKAAQLQAEALDRAALKPKPGVKPNRGRK